MNSDAATTMCDTCFVRGTILRDSEAESVPIYLDHVLEHPVDYSRLLTTNNGVAFAARGKLLVNNTWL